MYTIQVAASNPGIYVRKKYHPHHFLATPLRLSMDAKSSRTFLIPRAKTSSGLQHVSVLKSRKPLHVCLAGGKGMMDNSEVIHFQLSYTMHFALANCYIINMLNVMFL